MSEKQIGIVERVKSAATQQELNKLGDEVKGYAFISAQTLSRFRRALKRRQQELKNASNV